LDLKGSKIYHGENCIMMSFMTCILRRILLLLIKSRRMRWAEHVARMGEESGAYMLSVGRPKGKRPVGRPWRSCVYNFKMDI